MLGKLFEGVAEAIRDIRHKLVEEGWFGREVTTDTPSATTPEATGWEMARASFDEQWAVGARDHAAPAAHDPAEPGLDR